MRFCGLDARLPPCRAFFLVAPCPPAAPSRKIAHSGARLNRCCPAAVTQDQSPFFPQQKLPCGPAALTTPFNAPGTGVTPEELARLAATEKLRDNRLTIPGLGNPALSLQHGQTAEAAFRKFADMSSNPVPTLSYAHVGCAGSGRAGNGSRGPGGQAWRAIGRAGLKHFGDRRRKGQG